MAQVPYSPVPDIAPPVPGPARVGIDTPPAAFGAATAAATSQLGQETERSADEMFGTYQYAQGIRNETLAKNAFVQYSLPLGDLEEGFRKKRGMDAQAGYDEFKQKALELYNNAIASMPNPAAARMLGDSLSRRITYSIEDAGRHAGQQEFVATDKASDDASALHLSNIQANPTNPNIVRQSLDGLRHEAEVKTNLAAGSASDFSQRAEKMVSEGLTIQLKAIGYDDPQTALKMLEANQQLPDGSPYKMKSPGSVESIKEWLQRRNDIVGASDTANKILFGDQDAIVNDKSLTPAQRVGVEPAPGVLTPDSGPEYLADALKRAREAAKPYGAEFEEHLLAQVKNKYNDFHNAYKLQEYGVYTMLSAAITGANGQPPITDRSGLFDNPVLYEQYQGLGETATGKARQTQLLNMIDRQSHRGSLDGDQQRALVDRIRGFAIEAQRDPAARDEFYKMDWGDLYSKVDPGLKSTLSSEQEKVRNAWAKMGVMPGDERTAEAIGLVKPMMDSAGIKRDPNNKAANNQYYEFVGALSAKIQAQEAVTGKRLGDKDIQDLAASLIQRIGGIGNAVKNNGGVGAVPKGPQAQL